MSEYQAVNDFMSLVNKGREGRNQGCPIGLDKLADYIGDLCRGQSILIGAPSGVGCCKNTAVLVEESLELLSGNIGESPKKENPEINSETKESESSYSVEGETSME